MRSHSVISVLRLWLSVHNSGANVPMKLNAPDGLLSKLQDIFDPVLIIELIKRFYKDFHNRCFVDLMIITEFSYFAETLSIGRKRYVIRRTADIYVCVKRKLELILTFRNAGNVKSN